MRAATMLQDGRRARARRRGTPAVPGVDARPVTLPEMFAATAARHLDEVALDAPDARLTYAELKQAAGVLADRLSALGIGRGDRVGVRITSGTAELYVAILGVICTGAAYVPIEADDPESQAQALWRRAGVCAVLSPGLEITERAPSLNRPGAPAAQDDAWVIFTSGSTGEPKGVAVSHASAVGFVDAEAELWRIDPTDRVLASLSVSFDAGCAEIWLAWRHGAALVPAPRALVRSGAELGRWIADRGITVVSTVPSLAAMWDHRDLDSVRLLILGGKACPESLGWALAAGREARSAPGEHPWRATGLETQVFADPSGRRARTMSGIGLAILAATLLALVIVVTAAIGFSSMPAPVRPTQELGARAAASTATQQPANAIAAVSHPRAARRDHARRLVAKRLDAKTTVASDRDD